MQPNPHQEEHKNALENENLTFQAKSALRCAQFFLALSESCYDLSKKLKGPEKPYQNSVVNSYKTKAIIKQRKSEYGLRRPAKYSPKHQSSKQSEPHHFLKDKIKSYIGQREEALKKQKEDNGRYKPSKDIRKEKRDQQRHKMKQACIKRPIPAYIFYYQSQQKIFAEKNPGLGVNELTKLIASEWKNLNEEQKQPFFRQASEARNAYEDQKNQLFGIQSHEEKVHAIKKNGNNPVDDLLKNDQSPSNSPSGSNSNQNSPDEPNNSPEDAEQEIQEDEEQQDQSMLESIQEENDEENGSLKESSSQQMQPQQEQ